MKTIICYYRSAVRHLQKLDFLPLLMLRLYLAPVFIIAGWNKYQNFSDMVEWYGNADWGLGLPLPALMVVLTIIAELVGGLALALGVLTRFFSFTLLIAMAVAAFKVHWRNGWFAIAPSSPDTSSAKVLSWLGIDGANQSLAASQQVAERLERARGILQEYGNYDYLTEMGNFVILNNGIEFAATYFIMLSVLFIYGAGKVFSLDYWLTKSHRK